MPLPFSSLSIMHSKWMLDSGCGASEAGREGRERKRGREGGSEAGRERGSEAGREGRERKGGRDGGRERTREGCKAGREGRSYHTVSIKNLFRYLLISL